MGLTDFKNYILGLFLEVLVDGVQTGHWPGVPSLPTITVLFFLLTLSVSSDARYTREATRTALFIRSSNTSLSKVSLCVCHVWEP
jgi:hypothetical protein